MKKLLAIVVLGLLLSTNANSALKSYYEGTGELVLSKEVADLFIKYIKKELKGRLTDIKNTDAYKELQKAVASFSGT